MGLPMTVETDGFMTSMFFDLAAFGGVKVWSGDDVVPTSQLLGVSDWPRRLTKTNES